MPVTRSKGRILLLAQSAVAVPSTGDTNENTLATVSVPGGSLGPNGRLRVTVHLSHTNSANAKTLRVKLGATTFLTSASTTAVQTRLTGEIANRNSASSQVASMTNGGIGTSGSALVTGAIDTAADASLTITLQLALGSETVTLESYTVELLA